MFPKQVVKWHPKNKQLSQVPKKGLEYAFLSEDFEQIHQLVWCKDFLQDAIHAHINQTKASIYGFTYEYGVNKPLYFSKTRLMISNWKDSEFRDKIPACLELLCSIEDQLKMHKTKVYEADDLPPIYRKSGVFIFDGSPRWMKSPPMISLYSLLIRMGMIHTSGESFEDTFNKIKKGETYFGSGDKSQLSGAKKAIDLILERGDQTVFYPDIEKNYPSSASVDTMHNRMGIQSYSAGCAKNDIPHWYRFEETSA